MMGLWADGWFYISSAGLLVSGILFFFLLGQYRVASEAADVTDGEQGADKEVSAPAAIRPVYIPDDVPPAKIASHSDKIEAKPKSEGEYSGPDRRKDQSTTTGGISPAVVYLQNIKVELADLHKDLRTLAKRLDDELSAVSTRDEALIERLGEIARAVETLKAVVPVEPAKTEPAPKKARKTEKPPEPEPVPEPAPVVVAAAPEPEPAPAVVAAVPEPEPARSPDETIRMELGALISPPAEQVPAAPEPQPEQAQAEQAPVPEAPPEEKPRRGPVWPV